MRAIDSGLEWLYDRFGWRMVWVVFGLIAASHAGFFLTAALVFARFHELSATETRKAVAIAVVNVLLFVAATVVVAFRITPRTRRWFGGEPGPHGAEAAWVEMMRAPRRILSSVFLISAVGVSMFLIAVSPIISVDARETIFFTLWNLGASGFIAIGTMATWQLAVRPIVAELGRSLAARPAPPPGVDLRTKLLLLAPILPPFTALYGVLIALEPGADPGGALPNALAALALIAFFMTPVVLLLGYSALKPLDDLLAATERLKQGDYSTRVPELSSDEAAVLARSFNEAMEGLAERERLAGENERLLEEVRASRARIVEASDAERRRVERNIHDGAQQQLVALVVKLRLLEEDVADDARARAKVVEIEERLKGALGELRELARGLHPTVLTTDGLPLALDQLAARAPLPVSVSAPSERFASTVESTAYFVACEALANVAKYAQASQAQITVAQRNGHLTVEVADDGIGGAHAAPGSGLAGLLDRVAALDGTIAIDSPPGAGTKVTAELPL